MVCSNLNPLHFHQLIYDVTTRTKIADISGSSEGDQVAYNPNLNLFFGTGYTISSLGTHQVFTVVNAASPYNLIQTVSTSGTISHAIATDPATGYVFVPLSSGVGVYVNFGNNIVASMLLNMVLFILMIFMTF